MLTNNSTWKGGDEMKSCCGIDVENICSQLECNISETKEGIQVDIKPKDPKKTESLKALAKGCRDFCGCC